MCLDSLISILLESLIIWNEGSINYPFLFLSFYHFENKHAPSYDLIFFIYTTNFALRVSECVPT